MNAKKLAAYAMSKSALQEIASFAACLASPEAGYITGANLTTDGGFDA